MNKHIDFWEKKSRKGDSYVGRSGEDYIEQQKKIEKNIFNIFNIFNVSKDSFIHGLDFGCGYGRFIPLLLRYCESISAIDILDFSDRFKNNLNVTFYKNNSLYLPFCNKTFDFFFICLVLQHLVSNDMFLITCQELRRVAKNNAKFMIIDNACDNAKHVISRSPIEIIKAIKIKDGWVANKITINKRENDHWLIYGQ